MAIKHKENLKELVAKVVRVTEANKRRATAKTKKRGEVSGGGKKPWKQKGTGRARAGSSRSPIWRGGGITFGPTGDQNPSLSLNKKEAKAVRDASFESKKEATITVEVGKITKTKEAAEILKKNNLTGRVLVLSMEKTTKGEKETENLRTLRKAFANLKDVKFAKYTDVSGVDVLRASKIMIIESNDTKKVSKKDQSVKSAKSSSVKPVNGETK